MKKTEVAKVETKNITNGIEDINQDTFAVVLKQLEKFEKDKKFLEKDLTLVKLSALFDSNTKYLSKIIYYYRGKNLWNIVMILKLTI